MMSTWMDLRDEMTRWKDAGTVVDFWWRDDDACREDPALTRLVTLAAQAQVPLALAVIPHGVQPELLAQCPRGVRLLQHGCDHTDRSGVGEKKTEFPVAEPVAQALARLQAGWALLQGPAALPVLVPPWNRIGSISLPGQLAQAGFRGLSRFGARARAAAWPGLVQVNTHVDIIDWHRTRGFVGEGQALHAALLHLQARRTGQADPHEATGWLTHHLVHDAACWDFLTRLFAFCSEQGAVVWQDADRLFAPGPSTITA